jgi:hypothetical protein
MAKANENKLAYALLDLYSSQYLNKYGRPCTVNKYRDKWAMLDVIDSVGFDRSQYLLSYYFSLSNKAGHTLQWFLYNFDRLDDMLKKHEEDIKRRAMIREKTKEMVKENSEH